MLYAVAVTLASAALLGLSARRFGRRALFGAIPLSLLLVPGGVLYARLGSPGVAAALGALPVWLVKAAFVYGALAMVAFAGGMILAPRLRSWAWVGAVTVPGSVWAAGTFLAIPWVGISAIATAFVHVPALGWLPFAIAAASVPASFLTRREVVRIVLDDADAGPTPRRVPVADRTRVAHLPTALADAPLRLVQITDPHLGAFRSEASLRALCERAVAAEPDLVLLTGDFFTREGATSPAALVRALEPLRPLSGRTFACLGNHDHEAPEAVASALAASGVRLLVDEAVTVPTRVGPVQIVGLEHRWRDLDRHSEVLARHTAPEGALRLVLLHDPSGFRHLPPGSADLVLSGHTHGGHVGLVSLGFDWTAIHAVAGIPDHGLWGRGRDRLYVHRGTGHYGFPLRIGVPAEESVIELARA